MPKMNQKAALVSPEAAYSAMMDMLLEVTSAGGFTPTEHDKMIAALQKKYGHYANQVKELERRVLSTEKDKK